MGAVKIPTELQAAGPVAPQYRGPMAELRAKMVSERNSHRMEYLNEWGWPRPAPGFTSPPIVTPKNRWGDYVQQPVLNDRRSSRSRPPMDRRRSMSRPPVPSSTSSRSGADSTQYTMSGSGAAARPGRLVEGHFNMEQFLVGELNAGDGGYADHDVGFIPVTRRPTGRGRSLRASMHGPPGPGSSGGL